MCRKISGDVKSILGVHMTGKDLFESVETLSTPVPSTLQMPQNLLRNVFLI